MRTKRQDIIDILTHYTQIGIVYDTGFVHHAQLLVIPKGDISFPEGYPADKIPVWVHGAGGWGETWYWWPDLVPPTSDKEDKRKILGVIPWNRKLVTHIHRNTPSDKFILRELKSVWKAHEKKMKSRMKDNEGKVDVRIQT